MGLRNDLIIQQLADSTPNSLIGFDGSGSPSLYPASGLTGTTGGGSGTVTGATNGLRMSGNGRLTALGGTLTGNTTIDGGNNNIEINNFNSLNIIGNNDFIYIGNNNAVIGIGAGFDPGDIDLTAGNDIILTLSGDLQINGSAGTSGYKLTSNGSNTPPTWQADTVTGIAITGATNGVSKSGAHKVKLGGTLTGNTTIALGTNWLLFSGTTGQTRFANAPRFSSTTASQFLKVDSNKDLVSIAGAASSDLVTGTDTTKPLTAAAFAGFRTLVRQSASMSSGTMNLDLNSRRESKFENTTTISSNFTITFSNDSNAEIFTCVIFVTGTVVITMPSSVVCEKDNGRWSNGAKTFTIVGGTAEPFTLSFMKLASTPLYEVRVSTAIHAS